MITVFNRKELVTTFSMEQQAKVRDLLEARGIDYEIRVRNTASRGMRGSSPTLGMSFENLYEYKIFVHKKYLEYAKHILADS